MSELGGVTRAYVFSQVAVLVFGWYEPNVDEPEHGVRIEVRRRRDTDHRGSYFAAQEVVVDQPLFRADLFDLMTEAPGNLLRAHYHPSFEGVEPSERHWDRELSADPFRWLAERLSDLEAIAAAAAGAAASIDPVALAADAVALRRVAGEVAAAAEGVLAEVRVTA